jgi:hypothetical protein
MNRLNRDAILKAQDAKHEDVEVPEWGGVVRVKALTAAERDRYEEMALLDSKGDIAKKREDIRAKMILLAVIHEDGTPMFSESDLKPLSAKSAKAVGRLFDVACRLSGIGKDDVKDLEKN